jgi:hypothetical protein
MAYSSKEIEKMEAAIPDRAAEAVGLAYNEAINSGLSVLIASNGILFEITADGHRKEIKKLPARIHVQKGLTIRINPLT